MESANQALRSYYRVAAPFHDADVEAQRRADVPFYVDIARRAGGPVFEVGCGTGRVGLEILRAGVNYLGIDLVSPMVTLFRAKLEGEPEDLRKRARVKEGDLRSVQLDRRFACAIAPLEVLQHLLTEEDRRRALNRIKAHLVPGGLFVFDLTTPTYAQLASAADGDSGKPQVELEREGTGKPKLRRTVLVKADPASQSLRLHREWVEVGPRGGTKPLAQADLPLRWLHRFEIELLLRQSGFEVLEHYGGFDRKPFDGVSGVSVIVARAAARVARPERRPSRRPSGPSRPGGFRKRSPGPRGHGGGYGRPEPRRGGYDSGYPGEAPSYPRPARPSSGYGDSGYGGSGSGGGPRSGGGERPYPDR
jgi:SAM-dependent methyltransferase